MDSITRKRGSGLSDANFKRTLNEVDSAIQKHIKENDEQSAIVTGWVFVASLQKPDDNDTYIVQSSLGLPFHSQVGLLNMAIEDRKNLGILATIQALMVEMYDDGETDSDD